MKQKHYSGSNLNLFWRHYIQQFVHFLQGNQKTVIDVSCLVLETLCQGKWLLMLFQIHQMLFKRFLGTTKTPTNIKCVHV